MKENVGDAQKYFNKWQFSENRRLSEIIQLDAFIKDLEHDVKALKELLDNLDEMNKVISLEIKEKPDENVIEKLKSLIIWWMKKKQGVEDEQLVNDIFDGGNLAMKKYKEGTPEERYHIENYDLITWFVISKNKNFL